MTNASSALPPLSDRRAPAAGGDCAEVGRIGSIAYTRERGGGRRRPARPGVFITLEGPDGSGKSSLLPRLAAALGPRGCDVVTTREPGSTPLGEQVRRLVLDPDPPIDRTGRADALLFAASRAQHVEEVIRPALARGAVVVCDRYADSSLAYQGAGSGVPMDELRAVQHFATGGLVRTSRSCSTSPSRPASRRKSAEITRFEAYHDVAYHERVRAAFLGFAADEPGRYAIVDATRTRGRRAGRGGRRAWPRSPVARLPGSPRLPCAGARR